MDVIACDPGITHLGMVRRVDDTYVYCTTNDLTRFRTKQLADRVNSFLNKYNNMFSMADTIVMEIQPPGGGGDVVAQLIYQQLRDKIVWVHPCTLHAHFGMKGLDYEDRKRRSIELATADLSSLPRMAHGQATRHERCVDDGTILLRQAGHCTTNRKLT